MWETKNFKRYYSSSSECFSLCSYLLFGYTKKDVRSNEANMIYLLMGTFTSSLPEMEMAGERKESLFEGTPGNESIGDDVRLVAQRIRALAYELQCWGFQSLLALSQSEKCIVGIGLEQQAALDLGALSMAEREGRVVYVDTDKILLCEFPIYKYDSFVFILCCCGAVMFAFSSYSTLQHLTDCNTRMTHKLEGSRGRRKHKGHIFGNHMGFMNQGGIVVYLMALNPLMR